ncbi:hypothetical protein CAPN002_00060 [Capnocytophaga stomatis]|uniref:hypothetical protein n=1 Tax=Capnocytophaga stomatis TaxID=1848904 RepID=UPI00194E423B|nr:hypothetical protein [Capnocytophaga stomatis]GIJ92788.1 hypothetical protein CAPN002_00060 [Capnocytophaga stomatis]
MTTNFSFKKLTNEERQISNDFFELVEKYFPEEECMQEKYNNFFALFLELCLARQENPNQTKLELMER